MKTSRVSIVLASASVVAACWSASARADDRFDSRAPRVCDDIKGKPSAEQAAALVQCHQEYGRDTSRLLLENVRVQMGASQPYDAKAHSRLTAIDTTSQVVPIKGSFVQYQCSSIAVYPAIHSYNRGKNCSYANKPAASGSCWKTTFGNSDCFMTDIDHNDVVLDQPPPRS